MNSVKAADLAKAKLISREVKQSFLDEIHDGKTIGEAMKASGIDDLGAAGEIVLENISAVQFLRKEAV